MGSVFDAMAKKIERRLSAAMASDGASARGNASDAASTRGNASDAASATITAPSADTAGATITAPCNPADACKCKSDITLDNIYLVAAKVICEFPDKYMKLFVLYHEKRLPGDP